MSMYNLDLLTYNYIAEYGEKREDCWHRRFSVYNKKRNMIDLEAICQVSNSCSALVRVGNDDNFVSSVNQFLGDLLEEWPAFTRD